MVEPRNKLGVDAFCLAVLFALGLSGFLLPRQVQGDARTCYTLNESINPNTASVASLLRLSGIGPVRARAMVAYRQAFTAKHPGQKPFQKVSDVMRVKGLGPRTADAVRQWLVFDDTL